MSAPLWTSADAAAATGGIAIGQWHINGLSIDTRSLKEGDLFVPLKDARDGHDFIPAAYEAGAGATISEHPIENAPALVVKDNLQALRDLAIAARRRSKSVRVAVTGSVGKTSVKEAIATIFEASGKSHKSIKSFNNHWGAPLTLAGMPQGTEFSVFELGMNHAGELADLSPLISPDVAVITKIAPVHLAHFNSVEAIADAKAEIFEGMTPGSTAILNADDDYFKRLSAKATSRGLKVVSVGTANGSDVHISDPVVTPSGVSAALSIAGKTHALKLAMPAPHWIFNGACSVAAAQAAGISPAASLKALAKLKPMAGRGETFKAKLSGKSVTVIDESYNANPESMRAAIAGLSQQAGSARKIAVLGAMGELGKDEIQMHADLSGPLVEAGVSRVVTTGECMRALRGALPQSLRAALAKDYDFALRALKEEVQDGDFILIKGSNAAGLGKLVAAIKSSKEKSKGQA